MNKTAKGRSELSRAGPIPLKNLDVEPVVGRRTIQEGVYQGLSHALMTGRFDPGQTLTISSLSELFGTSHMPVREALRRLAAENAVEIASTGSARVPNVSRARLDDLYNARVIVEGAATEMAVPNINAQQIRALEYNLADHLAAGREDNIQALMTKNQEFHFIIYRASRSEVLVQLVEALWLRFGPYLRMLSMHMEPLLKSKNAETYTRHHQLMIDALKRKDTADVREHMINDIKTTHALLQTLVTANDKLSRDL
jgi:DNA-binding GntR family transcriptional regulator